MTTAVIIPARYESTRFPGKPLAKINGKPVIEWVVEAAKKAKKVNKVIVATDDKRILDFVKNLGIEPCLTLKEHKCGTDRIAEVVKQKLDIEYVVNLQGDEPLMPPDYIDEVFEALISSKSSMASLVSQITNQEDLKSPDVVKAIMDKDGYALNFSRSVLSEKCYRHIGIYAYTREALIKFTLLPQSELEKKERLEQLRALENGIRIKLRVVPNAYPAVDRPEDIKVVESILLGV